MERNQWLHVDNSVLMTEYSVVQSVCVGPRKISGNTGVHTQSRCPKNMLLKQPQYAKEEDRIWSSVLNLNKAVNFKKLEYLITFIS